jgi:hypothetical protein
MTECSVVDCHEPGEARLVAKLICIAGVTPKVGAREYVLCDEHWRYIKGEAGD